MHGRCSLVGANGAGVSGYRRRWRWSPLTPAPIGGVCIGGQKRQYSAPKRLSALLGHQQRQYRRLSALIGAKSAYRRPIGVWLAPVGADKARFPISGHIGAYRRCKISRTAVIGGLWIHSVSYRFNRWHRRYVLISAAPISAAPPVSAAPTSAPAADLSAVPLISAPPISAYMI